MGRFLSVSCVCVVVVYLFVGMQMLNISVKSVRTLVESS